MAGRAGGTIVIADHFTTGACRRPLGNSAVRRGVGAGRRMSASAHAPGMDHEERGFHMKKFTLLAAFAGLALIAACASDEPTGPAKVGDSGMGKVLTDAKGMTLYTF